MGFVVGMTLPQEGAKEKRANEVPGGDGGKENNRRGRGERQVRGTKYEVEIWRNSVAQGGEAGTVMHGGAMRACVARGEKEGEDGVARNLKLFSLEGCTGDVRYWGMDRQQRADREKRLQNLESEYLKSSSGAGTKLIEEFCQSDGDLLKEEGCARDLIYWVIREGDLRSLQILRRVCIDDVNAPVELFLYSTLLQCAAWMGKDSIVRWLLAEGADVDAAPGNSYEPIMLAT